MDRIKCPVCNKDFKTIVYEKQEVNVCQTCGGIWFDKGELMGVVDSLFSKGLITSESAVEAYGKKAVSTKDIEKFGRYCPRCKVELEVFNFFYDSNVFLDRCPVCFGVWADRRELKAITKYIKGNPEVDKLVESLFVELRESSGIIGNISKVAVVIVSLFYLIAASVFIGLEGFLRVLMILVLPLACIFFGEDMGKVTCARFGLWYGRPTITKPSPGFIVVIVGWLVLLLPFFVYILEIFSEM